MTSTTLTVKQSRFVDDYIINGNATEAARRAGYSERTARQIATENLTKPAIRARIQALQQANATTLELSRQDVMAAILGAIQTAREQRAPVIMIRGFVEIARLCGFYDSASLAAEKRLQTAEGSKDVRHVPTAELLRMISHGGEFRNPDGSMMDAGEVDVFYKGLSTAEITALAEGRARIEMRVEMS